MSTLGRTRMERLRYWNRLFHGIPVSLGEMDGALRRHVRNAPYEEKRAFILLRTCVRLTQTARPAHVYALRIAILYWFSNARSSAAAAAPLNPKRSAFHLAEAMGCRLTWDEAVEKMGRKPIDFSAYQWMLELLEEEYRAQWTEVFGEFSRAPAKLIDPEDDRGDVPPV